MMNLDGYAVGAIARAQRRPLSLDELRAAALAAGDLGTGWRFERRFAEAVAALAFAGHLRTVARDRALIDPDPGHLCESP